MVHEQNVSGNVDDFVCLSLGSYPHLNTNADLLRDSCLVRSQLPHHTALAVYMDFQVIVKWIFCFIAAVIQEMRVELGEQDGISDCPNEYTEIAHCSGAI